MDGPGALQDSVWPEIAIPWRRPHLCLSWRQSGQDAQNLVTTEGRDLEASLFELVFSVSIPPEEAQRKEALSRSL